MDRAGAIAEIEWYRNLLDRRLRDWGRHLKREARERLMSKIERVQACEDLQFKQYDEGYYIGQLDEDGLRHGYGIYTRTTDKRDRWTMQAGEWVEERPTGSHTLYEADCPDELHYVASLYFRGRRRERGIVQITISSRGVDLENRKYRRWERFSLSTMAVGGLMIYIFLLALTRNAKIGLFVVAGVFIFYLLGFVRGRR
ncbi:MAG: hypothetical protein Q4F42_03040 [Rikenellaceae bacterium]|nr:hypothetical protein [Rikenellaceae bacterium]MDO5487440.1 hypothetical protein [Rikenellaceae bacterium]